MFASLQNKRKLEEATSSKDDVTPVYLLEEIWELVRTSSPDMVAGMVMYLNNRLANKSPVVKQKTCRLIKYICSKGSSEFKRNISKHAASVRELTSYKGEPDPFKGDVPNQRVRDMAKEALDAMFAATDPSYTAAASQTPSLAKRIQGFGSSGETSSVAGGSISSSGQGSGGLSGSSRMMGFGNPKYEPPGGSRDSSSSVVSPKAILGTVVDLANQARAALPQGRSKSFLRTDDGDDSSGEDGNSSSGYSQPRLVTTSGPYGPPSGVTLTSAPVSSGSGAEEERLVDNICTPGGLRAQPDREDLRLFVETAAGLSGQRIAKLLQAKIEGPSWQVALRALCALEAVIQQGSSTSCGEIAVYFQADASGVQRAASSPQASVKQRGSRVLQLLGVSSTSAAGTSSKPSSVPGAAQGGAPDLLGDLLGDSAVPSGQAQGTSGTVDLLGDLLAPPTGSTLAGPPQANTLFGGLDMGGGTAGVAAATPAVQGNLFGGLDFGAAAPASNGSLSNGIAGPDLFGGLSVDSSGPTGLVAGQTSTPSSLNKDFFGGFSVLNASPAAPASTNGVANLLGGLSLDILSPAQQRPTQPTFSGLSAGMSHTQQPAVANFAAQGGLSLGGSASGMGMPGLAQPVQGLSPLYAGTASNVHMTAQNPYPPAQGMGQQGSLPYMQQSLGFQATPGLYPGQPQHGGIGTYATSFPAQGLSGYGASGSVSLGGSGAALHGKTQVGLSLLDGLNDNAAVTKVTSSVAGITSEATFDFVGDHISSLRSQK
eukprot:jgi/Botrbrau1/20174/Bobra.0173s0072.1